MWRVIMAAGLCAMCSGGAWGAGQEASAESSALVQRISNQVSEPATIPEGRRFFPQNFARGYVEFEMAPPHNEIDVGLCAVMKDNPLLQHDTCTAFARYAWTGYLELQPFGRGPWRRLYFFTEPKLYGGKNLPQESYTASGSLILWERTMGVGVELPEGFELRVKNHQVHLLGRYTEPGGTATLRTDGPYGQYTTIGVRWNFGGYGRSGGRIE
jgi:hypothetical protein